MQVAAIGKFAGLRLALASTLIGWALGIGLLYTPLWQAVELKVFDLMSVLTAPSKSALPITIVGIDEASFTQLGTRWPWPRDLHARLTDQLQAAGAAVIAFDVLFPEPADAKEDDAFAAAIARAGNVVLASDHVYHETAQARQWLRMDPIALFTQAGAATGLATMTLDGDAVTRRVANADGAFWRESIRALIRSRPGSVTEPYVAPQAMIRHLGPAHTFPYVSYYQVLNGDPTIPKDFFRDQIVLIGRDVRASLDSGAAQADTFATPFLMGSGLLTPGVEIQATQIENALMGQTITQATPTFNIGIVSLALLLMLPVLVVWNPIRATALTLLLLASNFGASVWMFANQNLWIATATPMVAMAVAYLTTVGGSYFTEQRRANTIRSAFSRYVSPDVVEEMIAHPEKLTLGGQRREITVLFSDLANFTSLSEKLPAETVGNLINTYLDEMTEVVMRHNGTVDKFIGDAVMAFWGAPLDDPDHALHATQAAIDMQIAMGRMQRKFRAMGVDQLGLRVGINSGPAIVGNMGSNKRFDYTAIGDTVNLASRLEGANKAFGTGILIGANTADTVRRSIALRQVDRVRVKGKNQAVQVFTPCDDTVLIALTDKAWAAYSGRDWLAAREAWNAVRAHAPGDTIAQLFLERIATFMETPPEPSWDDSTSLDKM